MLQARLINLALISMEEEFLSVDIQKWSSSSVFWQCIELN